MLLTLSVRGHLGTVAVPVDDELWDSQVRPGEIQSLTTQAAFSFLCTDFPWTQLHWWILTVTEATPRA